MTTVPPAAGQGVNQAFESAHSLSLVAGAAKSGKVSWEVGLKWWHDYRQTRVDGVIALTHEMSARRLPNWKPSPGGSIDNKWLFSVDVEGDVQKWVDSQNK